MKKNNSHKRQRPHSSLNVAFIYAGDGYYFPTHFRVQYNRTGKLMQE